MKQFITDYAALSGLLTGALVVALFLLIEWRRARGERRRARQMRVDLEQRALGHTRKP